MRTSTRPMLTAAIALAALAGAADLLRAEVPLVDLSKASFPGAVAGPDGPAFAFDLGTKRVNWNRAEWSVLALEKPADLRGASGLRLTVTTDKPRSDVGVYVAVQEADGSWYYHPWATELTKAENTGVARLEDFVLADWVAPGGGTSRDENGVLDVGAIKAIAIGTINPLGVGKVNFRVTSIAVVPEGKKGEAVALSVVASGRLLDFNGTTIVPAGLFGGFNLSKKDKVPGQDDYVLYRLASDRRVHGGNGTGGAPDFGAKGGADGKPPMMINVVGERVTAPARLNDKDWEAKSVALAEKFAAAANANREQTLVVEYWNEPYLNWSNKNRIAFNPAFFDESKAVEGGEVTLKIDGTVLPHLKWTRQFDAPPWNWTTPAHWRRGRTADGKALSAHAEPYPSHARSSPWEPASHPPVNVKDGEKYTFTRVDKKTKKEEQVELTAFTPWHVYDTTQHTYWSSSGMVKPYVDMMMVFGKTLHAKAPQVTFIAGWGFRPSEDHWAAWERDYKPTIDAGIEFIDGVHDHDYGSDAAKMAANYELVTAYGMTKHGKWLTSWNTETASMSDPQVIAGADELAKQTALAESDWSKFLWTSRKLVHTLDTVPDKARNFAWFGRGGGWFTDGGEGVVLTMLKNFRGRLVEVDTNDPLIYAAGCVDGTDPDHPRPADLGADVRELVVAVYNDHGEARAVALTLAAPAGAAYSGNGVVRVSDVIVPGKGPGFAESPLTPPGDGPAKVSVTIPAKGLAVVSLPLKGELAAAGAALRRQFFAKDLLVEVTGAKPSKQTLAIEPAALAGATRAFVRVAVERLGDGEGVVRINGKEYALPAAVTPENVAWVRQIEIAPADLKPGDNTIEFSVKNPAGAGFLLVSGSVIVEK